MKREPREKRGVRERAPRAVGDEGESDLFEIVAPASRSVARADGVSIGTLRGFDADGAPLVDYPENPGGGPVAARATHATQDDDVGREVALLFENGDARRPILIGCLLAPAADRAPATDVTIDGQRLVFDAKQEIVLRCGKATITLTRAGKILIRGAYVSSRSSGVNRVKGGSVQIN
jgi:hypothetical protein